MVSTKSICGVANLLAAVYGQDPNIVKRHLGLPYRTQKACKCGIRLESQNKSGLCWKHWLESKRIEVACSGCGNLFERRAKEVIYSTNVRGYNHFFCNKKCKGRWLNKNYGSPNIRRYNSRRLRCTQVSIP